MFRLLTILEIVLTLQIVKSEECKSLVDIVFLVDTSDSFGPVNFKAAKELMKTFVSGFTIGKHYALIGVDTFDDTFKSEFQLKTFTKKSSIITAIKQTKYRGRGTNTVKALEKARQISFSSGAGSRIDATKVAIMITDGWSYNMKGSKAAATQLKQQGVFLYTIGIGDKILQAELQGIATDPKRKFSFKVKTRSEAIKLAKVLIKYICKVSHGPFPREYVGCFKKQKTYKYTKSSHMMTPQICINICKPNAYKYANIQGGGICHCGQTIQTEFRRHDKTCNVRCHGNKNIICGGATAVAVYKTGYIGCFADSWNRLLKNVKIDSDSMTPELCISICKDKSYRYSGVQYSHECFCGDDHSRGNKRPDSECNSGCRGDGNRKCGGVWRMNVFETDAHFIGCFKERSNGILNAINLGYSGMTIDVCRALCREKGYSYSGTKKGNTCSCGNEFHESHETKKDKSKCNQKCSGNKNQNCGGPSTVSVYYNDIRV